MHNITNVPISPDPTVFRRYDVGITKQLPEIPFFALQEDTIDNRGGKVYQMCNEVGGGGGSLRYTLVTNNTNIVHCNTTIYPCILHEVKMTFKGYKSLPKNLKGIKIDVLILNLMT